MCGLRVIGRHTGHGTTAAAIPGRRGVLSAPPRRRGRGAGCVGRAPAWAMGTRPARGRVRAVYFSAPPVKFSRAGAVRAPGRAGGAGPARAGPRGGALYIRSIGHVF